MKISVRRLAQLAGVSPMTASRAIRGCGDVSEKTRRKILAVARKNNFPLPAVRATELPNLLNVLCSLVDIEGDEARSEKGFNRRLLTGLRIGSGSCGSELVNITPNTKTWPLVVNRQQVDGVIMLQGNEFQPHPPFPIPVPVVFIFSGVASRNFWPRRPAILATQLRADRLSIEACVGS